MRGAVVSLPDPILVAHGEDVVLRVARGLFGHRDPALAAVLAGRHAPPARRGVRGAARGAARQYSRRDHRSQ